MEKELNLESEMIAFLQVVRPNRKKGIKKSGRGKVERERERERKGSINSTIFLTGKETYLGHRKKLGAKTILKFETFILVMG